jgi:hypothetical protein
MWSWLAAHHQKPGVARKAPPALGAAAVWWLLPGAMALMLGLALDQGLNAGALLMVVKKSRALSHTGDALLLVAVGVTAFALVYRFAH